MYFILMQVNSNKNKNNISLNLKNLYLQLHGIHWVINLL